MPAVWPDAFTRISGKPTEVDILWTYLRAFQKEERFYPGIVPNYYLSIVGTT